MDQVTRILLILALIAMIVSVNKSDAKTVIATINDNGIATHIDIPAQSEYREYNEGNL